MAVSNSTDRFNGVLASKAIKVPVKRAATTPIATLSGAVTVDLYTFGDGDRILLTAQTNPVENGIWVTSASSAWERAPDFDGSRDATANTLITAERSGVASPLMWRLSSPTTDPVRIGTDSLTFVEYFDPDAPAAADLQAVTDVGNTTDNAIVLTDAAGRTLTIEQTSNPANMTVAQGTGPTVPSGIQFLGGLVEYYFDNTIRVANGLNAQGNGIIRAQNSGATESIAMQHDETVGRLETVGGSVNLLLSATSDLVLTDGRFRVENTATDYIEFDSAGNVSTIDFGSLVNDLQIGGSSNITRTKLAYAGSLAVLETNAAPADEAAYGQIWVRNDAPNTLMFTDDAGSDYVIAGGLRAQAAGLDTYEYEFSTATGDADPGAGVIRFNNVTPASVTALYIDDVDIGGLAVGDDMISELLAADVVKITSTTDPEKSFKFVLSAAAVDATGYWRLTGVMERVGALPLANEALAIHFTREPNVERGTAATDILEWSATDGWVPAPAVRTHSQGIHIAGSAGNDDPFIGFYSNAFATRQAFIQQTNTGAMNIKSEINSGGVVLAGFDSVGGNATMGVFEPDAAVDLYYDNSIRFSTLAAGISVRGSLDNAIGGVQNAQMLLMDDSGDVRADLGFPNSATLYLRNLNHGGALIIQAEDALGNARTILNASPDGSTVIRGDSVWQLQATETGLVNLARTAAGIVTLYSDGNTDAENRYLNFAHQDGTQRGRVGYFSGPQLQIYNQVHGGNIVLVAEQVTTGNIRRAMEIDPDGDVDVWAVVTCSATKTMLPPWTWL